MKRGIQGILTKATGVGTESYETYYPNPLPPEIDYSAIKKSLEMANRAIGELNGVVGLIPDSDIINYIYVRKEAVLSSQIEGTQSTLDDLLKYEASGVTGVPVDDISEVSSYVAAMNYGLKRLDELPLSLRLIREIHKVLLSNNRGKNKTPGEFRTSQNWIGGTRPGTARFVPTSPEKLAGVLGNFEKFMNEHDEIPELVRAAFIHHQFETIHPFLDGNGRIGRLLITFYLTTRGFLDSPYLYLSLFFKKHRQLYYDYLNEVRLNGDWEQWLNFFLEGVAETATDAKNTLMKIRWVFQRDETAVAGIGRSAKATLKVLEQFRKKPMLKISELVKKTGLSRPTTISSVSRLMELKILAPLSEQKWGQTYVYSEYVNSLGTDK
jgi:Fic family protein